jgi:hypothetical protein
VTHTGQIPRRCDPNNQVIKQSLAAGLHSR